MGGAVCGVGVIKFLCARVWISGLGVRVMFSRKAMTWNEHGWERVCGEDETGLRCLSFYHLIRALSYNYDRIILKRNW